MDAAAGPFLPSQASTLAPAVDAVHYFVLGISIFFFLLIVGLMLTFVIRYRRRRAEATTPDLTHNHALEIFWSVTPLLILAAIFTMGFNAYMAGRVAPDGALEVYVTGRQWSWSFSYPREGIVSPGELVVPVGRPVKLVMASEDVIHSFFVPAFRVKQDVLPNRYTTLWFEATMEGEFVIFCTEYCGTSHSDMIGTVIVKSEEEYRAWVESGGVGDISQLSMAEYGALLFRQNACNACHAVDGTRLVGPPLNGIFGHRQPLTGGDAVTVDEEYLRESIVNPNAKVVDGYSASMPAFPHLKPEQVGALIEYIKSLEQ